MSSRPRRTRLYNTAYNIGESYYKPALDRLDRKYSGRPMFDDPLPRPRFTESVTDDDLSAARKRAERVINEQTFFDSKGLKTTMGAATMGAKLSSTLDNDFDDEIQSTLNRIRANKKTSAFTDDADFEAVKSSATRRSRFDYSDKKDDSNIGGGDDSLIGFKRRVLKVKETTSDDIAPSALTKWSKLSSTSNEESSHIVDTSASLRAQATKSRLAELDEDIVERSERQAAREKRLGNIRKLLAESEEICM